MPDEIITETATDTAPPMTIEAELAAAFAVVTPTDNQAPTAEVAAEPKPVVKTTEEPKAVAAIETSLARRLAMVAAAERKAKAAATARDAAESAAKPDITKLQAARAAKTRMEQAKIALDLDDEGLADLFLELHQHHAGEGQAVDPEVKLAAFVQKKLDEALSARDRSASETAERNLNEQRANYTAETLAVLDARGDDFPLVAIAPPSQVDITAISEAWLIANREIPEPEEVLKLIQDERQVKLDKRRKPEAKASSEEAASATAGETGGGKAKPIRRDDVPITKPRRLSVEEEFMAAYGKLNTGD